MDRQFKKGKKDGKWHKGAYSPLAKHIGRERIKFRREGFEGGNRFELLYAIRICVSHNLSLPPWAQKAFADAFDKVTNFEVGSWDDVFGRPVPKGKHLDSLHRNRFIKYAIYNFVRDENEKGERLDEALFERAADKFDIGKTLASELYYAVKKEYP